MNEATDAARGRWRGEGIGDVGLWVKLRSGETVDIAADAGFSFIVVDLEHSPISLETAADHIALGTARGLAVLVRVATPRAREIGPVLDAGATGIVVARVDTAEDATAALAATRFAPDGVRGSGSTGRAGRWGISDRGEYLEPENGPPLCIVQIESAHAIANLDEILNVGVDAVLFGPADLRLSLGSPSADDVRIAVSAALETVRRSGVPCGTAASGGESAALALAQGFDFVVAAADTSLLARAALETAATARDRTRHFQ